MNFWMPIVSTRGKSKTFKRWRYFWLAGASKQPNPNTILNKFTSFIHHDDYNKNSKHRRKIYFQQYLERAITKTSQITYRPKCYTCDVTACFVLKIQIIITRSKLRASPGLNFVTGLVNIIRVIQHISCCQQFQHYCDAFCHTSLSELLTFSK